MLGDGIRRTGGGGWPTRHALTVRLASALLLSGGLSAVPGPAGAQSLPTAAENLTPGDIDSEHLFGFAEGSDIGVPGEVELEWESTGRVGRRPGRFRTLDSGVSLKVPLSDAFRVAPGVSFSAYEIGLPGTPTRSGGAIQGGSMETRLRLLDRRRNPFGLTLAIAPGYGTIDGATGLGARSFGTDIGLLADRELIPGRLVAAANIGYSLASTVLERAGERVRGSGIEASGALAYRLTPGFFVGGELRYARAYGGLTLDRMAGHALYAGPTFYATLSPHAWMSFAWSLQVSGRARDARGPLDLTSFDRQQMRLRVGYSF